MLPIPAGVLEELAGGVGAGRQVAPCVGAAGAVVGELLKVGQLRVFVDGVEAVRQVVVHVGRQVHGLLGKLLRDVLGVPRALHIRFPGRRDLVTNKDTKVNTGVLLHMALEGKTEGRRVEGRVERITTWEHTCPGEEKFPDTFSDNLLPPLVTIHCHLW